LVELMIGKCRQNAGRLSKSDYSYLFCSSFQCCRSRSGFGLDADPDWIRIQEGKNDPQKWEKSFIF
jgi:hypothetical protein